MTRASLRIAPSISEFPDRRCDHLLYVDKTSQIAAFLRHDKAQLFTRPRRFGKSLLLSTIEAMYSGNRDLFAGDGVNPELAIYQDAAWDWDERRVLRLDMQVISLFSEVAQVAIHVQRGFIQLYLEDYAAAWSDFDHVVKARPNVAWWHLQRGIASVGLGEYDKAIQLEPNHSWFYYHRGLVKQDLGCLAEAIADYDKALELASLLTEAEYLDIVQQIQHAQLQAEFMLEDSLNCHNL